MQTSLQENYSSDFQSTLFHQQSSFSTGIKSHKRIAINKLASKNDIMIVREFMVKCSSNVLTPQKASQDKDLTQIGSELLHPCSTYTRRRSEMGLENSEVARALFMNDILYRLKPISDDLPDWANSEKLQLSNTDRIKSKVKKVVKT